MAEVQENTGQLWHFSQLITRGITLENNTIKSLLARETNFKNLSLTINSSLKDLSLYNFRTEVSILGEKVNYLFKTYKTLPGVIVTQNNNFIGVISRRRFLEQISRPYGIELFFKRPLQSLYKFIPNQPLVLSEHTLIVEATEKVLERSFDLIDEPVVVLLESGEPCLLDVKELLIAYSTIHKLTAKLLTEFAIKLEDSNHQLEQLVNMDALTQLANRRFFNDYLHQEWQRLQRQQQPLSLIMIDIDYFKKYNDTYGHLQGDQCLQKVANLIKQSVKRATDLACRYGGEEFAIILPYTDRSGAFVIAQNIQEDLQEAKISHGNSPVSNYVTLSMGIASITPSSDQTEEILIDQADRALYYTKKQGRNHINIFTHNAQDN